MDRSGIEIPGSGDRSDASGAGVGELSAALTWMGYASRP
jgi:hypothetical protein